MEVTKLTYLNEEIFFNENVGNSPLLKEQVVNTTVLNEKVAN